MKTKNLFLRTAAFFAALFLLLPLANAFTVEISQATLQDKISKAMPYEAKKHFVTVRLSDPVLELVGTAGRVRITVKVDVIAPGNVIQSGRAKISGMVDYDATKGAVYLRKAEIEELTIEKLPEKLQPTVKTVAQLAAEQVLGRTPVYTFKDDLKSGIVKRLLKSINVRGTNLLLEFGLF